MNTRLIRAVEFQCLHRYENPNWSAEKNAAEFGACFSPNGHGHNYKLEVCVTGPIDKETGMVINLKALDEVIALALAKVKNKHLNFEVEEFKEKIPTTENLAVFLFRSLKDSLKNPAVRLVKVRLFENEDLWVDESEGL